MPAKKGKDDGPALWTSPPSDIIKTQFKSAVVLYCIDSDCSVKELNATVTQIKDILPTLHEINQDWESVTTETLNIVKYPAHKALYHTMRNLINN